MKANDKPESPLEAKKQYLVSRVSEALRARGMEALEGSQAARPGDLAFRRESGALSVECKVLSLYRESEFSAAIGDAILRFQHGPFSQQHLGRGLLLAFLIQRMSRKAVDNLRKYAAEYLPDLSWLVLSQDGSAILRLGGQEESIRLPALEDNALPVLASSQGSLFSPKNQWLLKLLLLPGMDSRYWGGPSSVPSSIRELAMKSGVSQPAVSSFISRAEHAGFLKRSADGFHIQHHRELLEDWGHALKQIRSREVGVKSLYGDDSEQALVSKLRSYPRGSSADPAVVVGGHLACHLLAIGRSNVCSGRLYVSGSVAEVLRDLDLVIQESGPSPLRVVSLPGNEAVFRCFVQAQGVPVSDILQCYFDVRFSYARGLEQADYIYERILKPHFERMV